LTRKKLSPAITEAWELVIGEIDEVRQMTAENGIPMLLLIAPSRFQLENPKRFRQPQDRLIDYAASREVPYIDLLPAFAATRTLEPSIELFVDCSHLTVSGHEIAAAFLLEPVGALLESGRGDPIARGGADRSTNETCLTREGPGRLNLTTLSSRSADCPGVIVGRPRP
jgi:hypothetical protein